MVAHFKVPLRGSSTMKLHPGIPPSSPVATSSVPGEKTPKGRHSAIRSPVEAQPLPRRTVAPGKSVPNGMRVRMSKTFQFHPEAAMPAAVDAFLSRIHEITAPVRPLEERAKAAVAAADTSADPRVRLRSARKAAEILEFALWEVQRVQVALQALAGQALQSIDHMSPADRAMASAAMQTLAETSPDLARNYGVLHASDWDPAERAQALATASTLLARERIAISRLAHVEARTPGINRPVDAIREAVRAVGETHGGLLPLIAQVQAWARTAQDEGASLHDEQVREITGQPPRFPDGPQKTELVRQVSELARTLPRPGSPADLGHPAVLRMALETLALVTGGDAARAGAALQALSGRPVQDWVPCPRVVPDLATEAVADVHAMLRVMNHLPRGLEAAGQLGASQYPPPSAAQLEAMRTYLSAEQAHQTAEPQVQAWLADAMDVALRKLHTGSSADVGPAARAAYAAVRSGLLSNAPGSRYQQLNQRLEQAFSAWITSAAEEPRLLPDWVSRWVPPKHLTRNVTPFQGATLNLGAHAAARTGLSTAATVTDERVRAAAALLQPMLPAGSDPQSLMLRTVLAYLQDRSTADVAGKVLTQADIHAMSRQIINAHSEAHSPHRLTQQIRAAAAKAAGAINSPGLDGLDGLARPGDTPAQVLERMLAEVAAPDQKLAEIREALQQALQAEAAAGVIRLKNGEDLCSLLTPLVAHLKPGDLLELKGAADTGVSVPLVPLCPGGLMTLFLGCGYHHERAASMEIKRDAHGVLFSLGSADLRAAHAQIGASTVLAPSLGVGKGGLIAGLRHERSKRDAEALILRVPGIPGGEAALYQEARDVLRDLTAWCKQKEGSMHPDMLSYLLSRHDNVDLIDASRSTRSSRTIEFCFTAGLLFPIPLPMRKSQDVGPEVSATYATSRQESQRRDACGHRRVAQADSAAMTERVVLSSGVSVPCLPAFSWRGYRKETKKTITVTAIGARLDAQLEHRSLVPDQILDELDTRREAWLAHAMAHDHVGRELAGAQLDAFIDAVKQVQAEAKTKARDGAPTYHFVINQILNESARTELEVLEGEGRLAHWHGDAARLAQIGADRKKLLDDAASWQPGALSVTAHAAEELDEGLPVGVILQRKFEAEARREVARFPAPARAAAT